MKLIDVSTPKHPASFAQVDEADYEMVAAYRWYAVQTARSRIYVLSGAYINGKRWYLHRFLLRDAQAIDHVDGNGLNNQRCNLRAANATENNRNRRKSRSMSSRFKGVVWHKERQEWRVHITVNRKQLYVGTFACEGCGAIAYDNAARKFFGEFARPNF